MLTGEKPYLGNTASALLFQHVYSPVPELPRGLARFQPLLAGLMAKDRRDRFADVADLFSTLEVFEPGYDPGLTQVPSSTSQK
jgi:serine/threonine-protein kinase PpkA